jgi:hypothetical protein
MSRLPISILTFLLVVLLMGCAQKKLTFWEPLLPLEELLKLADEAIAKREQKTKKGAELRFEVTTNPKIILAGSSVWINCVVPLHYFHNEVNPDGSVDSPAKFRRIRLELDGTGGEEALERIQTRRLFERLRCGTLEAVCTIAGPMDAFEQRRTTLLVKGECNSGDDK